MNKLKVDLICTDIIQNTLKWKPRKHRDKHPLIFPLSEDN